MCCAAKLWDYQYLHYLGCQKEVDWRGELANSPLIVNLLLLHQESMQIMLVLETFQSKSNPCKKIYVLQHVHDPQLVVKDICSRLMMQPNVDVKPHPIGCQGLCTDVVAYGQGLLLPEEEQNHDDFVMTTLIMKKLNFVFHLSVGPKFLLNSQVDKMMGSIIQVWLHDLVY